MNIPEGWKLVPVEPTLEMLEDGGDCMTCSSNDVWRAMLEAAPTPTIKAYWPESSQAAPTPPAHEDEPVAYVPVHPRNGPLWANTTAEPNRERLPSYPLMSLYTRPSSDNLGKAVEEVVTMIGDLLGDFGDEHFQEKMNNLRAALEGK